MEERLAAAAPQGPPGRPAYHALTYGWLASGLARAITGKGMRELVSEELAEPLGATGLELGYPSRPPAEILGASLRIYSALGTAATPLLGWLPVTRAGFRALHAPGFESLCRGPEPRSGTRRCPRSTARSARMASPGSTPRSPTEGSRPDGERFLEEQTVTELGRVQTRGMDRVLGVRMRWRLGFHHAFGTGTPAPRALGHYGFGGCGGWGDPDTGISFGFVSGHIGRLTSALGDLGIIRLSGTARACAIREGVAS